MESESAANALPLPSKRRILAGLSLSLILCLGCAFAFRAWDPASEISFSTEILDRDGNMLRLSTAADGHYRMWFEASEYAPALVQAVLDKEDRGFWFHGAVDLPSLVRALWHSVILSDYRSGASTITMQLARLMWRLDTGTVGGKLTQMAYATVLSFRYSKEEILTLYLNLVPCGGNVEGFGTASRIFYGKHPSRLNNAEAFALAVIPQDPNARSPLVPANTTEITAARDRQFAQSLALRPALSEASGEFAFSPRFKKVLPFEIPHLSTRLMQEYPKLPRIRTTVDKRVQDLVERRVTQFTRRNELTGLNNAAVMVVDASTMEVLASLGSASFFDEGILGQVDGTRARRSPGSALKPFIYALAMDQGIIHPYSVLKDSRTNFGPYSPDNFDNDFLGPIRAVDALVLSRNVPAVALAQRLSNPDLYEFLKNAGIRLPFDRDHYGLSLVLGSAEVSLEDLVYLYGGIARDGTARPLRYVQDLDYSVLPHWVPGSPGDAVSASAESERRLFSPEAAWLVRHMLQTKERPENDTGVQKTISWSEPPNSVAYKTGTSIGFRDAWSVGICDGLIIAVWVGDFRSISNPAYVGLRAAAPLMFDIIDALRAQSLPSSRYPAPAQTVPSGIVKVDVCAVSGMIAGPDCPNTVSVPFIAGVSPVDICTVHQAFFIDKESGLRRSHEIEGQTDRRVFELWPADIAAVFSQAGMVRKAPPEMDPRDTDFEGLGSGNNPGIRSPVNGGTYVVSLSDTSERIPFMSNASSDAKTVWWFVDNKLAGSVNVDQAFFWQPVPGKHRVQAVDDRGRRSDASFEVKTVQ